MPSQSVKKKTPSNQAGFVRQTINSDSLAGVLKIPDKLKHRMVEVILLPFEDDTMPLLRPDKAEGSYLQKFAGAWVGEPLVREDQGTYEVREELE